MPQETLQNSVIESGNQIPSSESLGVQDRVSLTVNDKLEIDISPRAILERAGIYLNPSSLNKKIKINDGEILIAELDQLNGCVLTTTSDGTNTIEVNGITSTGGYIELLFSVVFHIKDGGSVFVFHSDENVSTVESTDALLYKGRIYRGLIDKTTSSENGTFTANGKVFISAYREEPIGVNVSMR